MLIAAPHAKRAILRFCAQQFRYVLRRDVLRIARADMSSSVTLCFPEMSMPKWQLLRNHHKAQKRDAQFLCQQAITTTRVSTRSLATMSSHAEALAARESAILDAAQVPSAHAAEAAKVENEHLLAMSISIMILLNIISLGIGQWLHSKHIYWLPECGATIIVGFFAGWIVSSMLPPDVEREEAHLYFDSTFFMLFLLPPIIFDAGYELNMRLFMRNYGKILTLAIVGTLISTLLTWYLLYTDMTDMLIDLGFSESGQFAALISAVDPVATLSLFSTLKVDPTLNNMVVGESVLNDAVALITFRAITHYGVNMKNEWEAIVLSFVITGLGSALIGVVVGLAASLALKIMGMGRRGDLPHVETVIFTAFAYGSYVCSELPENSGIVAALFAGMTMRAFAKPNLSKRATIYVESLLKVMVTICDNIIYLLVGFALTIEIPYVLRPDLPGTTLDMQAVLTAFVYTLIVCLVARAVHPLPDRRALQRERAREVARAIASADCHVVQRAERRDRGRPRVRGRRPERARNTRGDDVCRRRHDLPLWRVYEVPPRRAQDPDGLRGRGGGGGAPRYWPEGGRPAEKGVLCA